MEGHRHLRPWGGLRRRNADPAGRPDREDPDHEGQSLRQDLRGEDQRVGGLAQLHHEPDSAMD